MSARCRDRVKAIFAGISSKIGPGSTIYSGLRTSLTLLKETADATEMPGLKGAVGGLLRVVEIIEKVAQNQDDAKELLHYLKSLGNRLNGFQTSRIPESLASRIEELSQEIIKIVRDIEKIKTSGTMIRFMRNDADASTLARYLQAINRLLVNFQLESSVAVERDIMVVAENVTKIKQHLIQDGLPRAVEARFDMDNRQRCLEGTRVELLDTICRWALQDNSADPESSASLFWLCGQAGTGKTTICSTVADTCDAQGRLGASFFFSRDREDRNNIHLVFPTIAHQLGTFCKDFEVLVTDIIRKDPDLVYSDPASQLEKLIINPIKACASFPSGTVIVMDALDECKDEKPVSTLLSMLSNNRRRLPHLKFFITSRPEHNIRLGFEPLQDITQSLILHDIDAAVVNADIELYLRNGFSVAASRYPDLVEQGWPSDERIKSLVKLSSGLFIFAATALRFILDENYSNPIKQLTILIEESQGIEASSSPFYYLDQLYLWVLRRAFPTSMSSDHFTLLKIVLGAIILVRNPLSPGDLESLLGLRGVIRTTLRHLHAILVVPHTDMHMIRLIHPSFFDFATTRCLDPQFRIDVSFHHEQLAMLSFDKMRVLKRDICGIGDASKLNEEIEDLPARIEQHIPPALRYACNHWAFHVCSAATTTSLLISLHEFCHRKLLYWIEALSLIGSLRDGIRQIQALQKHLPKTSKQLLRILRDSAHFIPEHFEVISSASLQLYRSALPLSSPSNSIRKAFSHELNGCARVLQRAGNGNYSGVTVLRGHSKDIRSAEFSPDGTLVVSASDDGVRLWDRGTGTLLKTLDSMYSSTIWVKFFPDGQRVISGDKQASIRTWDVTSGACLRTLLQLKQAYEEISGYTCSPDLTRIVGSARSDIMIWDVSNGALLNTLRGYESDVTSIAFPNHMLIASGSEDGIIQLWDAVTGAPLKALIENSSRKALTGHPNPKNFTGHSSLSVIAIAFSPCSKYLISSSWDTHLHLWDISRGVISNKFQGHSDPVLSVEFSLDGMQIISGSNGELQVWNAVKGKLLKTLRLGNRGDVNNVGFSFDGTHYICTLDNAVYIWDADRASDLDRSEKQLKKTKFSPDGTRIIASRNYDVQLWDGFTGAPMKVLKGLAWDTFPEFSPNNQYIATARKDHTIRLCDISCTTTLRTLRGHSNHISSLAFSSDSTQLVSTSVDGTLRIWDTTSSENVLIAGELETYRGSAHFSLDGSQIIADNNQCFDIPPHIRSHPVPLKDSGQLRYSINKEWVFASRGDKEERCIWLPADWREYSDVSSSGRVAIGTLYGLVLLDLSDIKLSI